MAGGLRVLIGEDQPEEAEGLQVLLEGLGHNVVGVAGDGADAVVKADTVIPDLVFLDIKMPGLDGLEATRTIMGRRPVPIILVTGYSDPELIQQAMGAGVMGYLVKPVDRKDLSPTIALALARFADFMVIRQDALTLREALALRMGVERATRIVTERLGIAEAEAHERLQRLGRRERLTLAEAAARVIAADKLFADLGGPP